MRRTSARGLGPGPRSRFGIGFGFEWMAAVIALGLAAPPSWAQGILVDHRPRVPVARSYEVRAVSIDARVRDQVAEARVSQTFHNPGPFPLEAEFFFPMPEEGAVQNFVLMVDGRELPGRLMPRDEARRIYEEIVRTKRDPALLEYMGRGLYRTSVFPIPPGADRVVTMRYTRICERDGDIVEFSYPLATQKFTARPIQRLSISLSIESRQAIKSIYCPSDDATIERRGDHAVEVRLERRDIVPTRDFRLVTTLAEGEIGATVLSYRPDDGDDGYFLLLASPEVKPPDAPPRPKAVVFTIDRSGSMAGKKIEQARRALKASLNNLRDGDEFNIVVYDDRVDSFRPELARYGPQARAEAERYIDNVREGGSTNIDAALATSLAMLKNSTLPGYVLFLTDGLPTAGEVDERKIAESCRKSNARHARVFCFGLGYDVNARLLDRLSAGNAGASEYVKPDDDLETHTGRFHAKMTRPALTDVRMELAGVDLNRVYPRDLPDLFDGGQLIVAGRYRQSGPATLKISGTIGDERRRFEFPAELARHGEGGRYQFVERLWATRRVGDLIDQIDLHGKSSELVNELVALSLKYGLLTPYTSFLADERTPLHAMNANARRAGEALQGLNQVSGAFGVAQRAAKQRLLQADRAPALAEIEASNGAFVLDANSRYQNIGDQTQGNGGMAGMTGDFARSGRAPAAGQTAQAQAKAGAPMRAGPSAGAAATAPQSAPAPAATNTSANRPARPGIRRIGAKTFYFKNGRWVDSTVKPDEEAVAIVVVPFSDEHFRLVRAQSGERNLYFSQSEPITVKLDGTVYRIGPPL